MPRMREPCPHGWMQPGDGWVVEKIFNRGTTRQMRCRLCKQNRLEKYGKDKRWHAIEQMAWSMPTPAVPEWEHDFDSPILREDWDWET